ncbi:MAG: 4Fe-4S binding protein [Lachnospiraceae bacterium]|nr:4Fe-4S binding protein [Lachnospiraceae bacterium]
MNTKKYLEILKNEIHSTVFATVDEEGLPCARVIDIMLTDKNSLYFLTAKGKMFYHQLMNKKYVAISGMTNEPGTMHKKSISVRGKIKNIGSERLEDIFKANKYMAEIYPTKESRLALQVFKLYEGEGEYFDLSTNPITRNSFKIGSSNSEVTRRGYSVNANCNGCKICYSKCPQKCINIEVTPVVIEQNHCLHCGNCYSVCPFGAVERVE